MAFFSLFPPNLNIRFVCLIYTNVASKTRTGGGIVCGEDLFLAVLFLAVGEKEINSTMNSRTVGALVSWLHV